MTLEKLAKQIFDECLKDGEPISENEALEMAKMELGAKSIKMGAKSENSPKKEKVQRIPQVSDEKIELFSAIWDNLQTIYGENAQIQKNNKEIAIQIGGKSFKIDIIEHRKAK